MNDHELPGTPTQPDYERFKDAQMSEAEQVAHRFSRIPPHERGRVIAMLKAIDQAGDSATTPSPFNRLTPTSSSLTVLTVDEVFDLVGPTAIAPSEDTPSRQAAEGFAALARLVLRTAPSCGDRASGLRKLREAWADIKSAHAHYGRF